ncbi:MAG: tRNA threonylcarbamoyladenosine dehydratase [Syntrophomonadaceae bacterium]|jgi:tRNA A37 threonylcarbamoyladenosine dehydratase
MQSAFSRTEVLLGSAGIEKLQHSSVTIIGLGGVGCYAAEAIARSGVGSIFIVDHDQVEISNINRQLIALHSTLGYYKTDVVANRLRDINPNLILKTYCGAYNHLSSEKILGVKTDYVIDAIDSLSDKIHLIKSCFKKNISIISSMGVARRLNPQALKIADIKDTSICPLARRVRRELNKENIGTGVKTVFSTEPPLPIAEGDMSELGSIVTVPATAGILLASVVINDLLAKV